MESKELAEVYIACLDVQQTKKGAGDVEGRGGMHLEGLGCLPGCHAGVFITEPPSVPRIWDAFR